jgi:16S rRNA (uracil1498-N3)-methyltransferase
MPRIFIDPRSIAGDRVHLGAGDAQYLTRVMRLGRGDTVELLDGTGEGLRCEIEEAHREGLTARVLDRFLVPEPPIPITLYQALPKGDKLELIIQKATELGVARIVPVPATRSVVQLKGDRAETKVVRWQKIAQEAAEQCERGKVPVVDVPQPLKDLQLADGTLGLVLSERVVSPSLPQALPEQAPLAIALFVGPEGGWTPEELATMRERGAIEVSLGNRILRTETAGLAALAMVMAAYELS